MKLIIRSIGLLVLLAASVRAAAVFPLPSFTVYGKVHDWNGRALSSGNAATVIVSDTNGVELARCDVKSGVYPTLTYRVQIPMASGRMAGRGVKGAPVTFKVYFDGQMHAVSAGQAMPVIGNPADAIACTLVIGTFTGADALPDEYKELLQPYYEALGRGTSLSDISGNDDFDGDGYSNLQEFMAGTIPVLGSDYLKINQFSVLANGSYALSFLSAPGRTYRVPKSKSVSSNSWETAVFAKTASEPPDQTFFTSEQDDNITLYLLPTTNTAAFFRLEAQ